MNKCVKRSNEILLIENNPGDVRLVEEAFRENGIHNNISAVKDGIDALDFLNNEGRYSGSPKPDLILLDLNLPDKDGRRLLKEIKENPGLKRIPVIVLTTSDSEQDVIKSYDLHANCYITKPFDMNRFVEIIKLIEVFWFGVVKLPPE